MRVLDIDCSLPLLCVASHLSASAEVFLELNYNTALSVAPGKIISCQSSVKEDKKRKSLLKIIVSISVKCPA